MRSTRVLIVDDSPANLKLARIALEGAGFEVSTASDGEEALQQLSEVQPSIVLMDLELPRIDGYELTRRIKSDPSTAHMRVIAFTASTQKSGRDRAQAAGCDDFIAKPVDPLVLPGLVARHFTLPSPAEACAPATDAILVIEDNPSSRKLIRVTLESEGYAVQEAADARSALDWLQENRPRIILQDLVLPDLDGLELLRRIRALPHGRAIPVLCLSGFIARMDEARALTDGFAALLIKPVDPIEVLDTVRLQLDLPKPLLHPKRGSKHVFVVDSDPLQRQLADYHLSSAGFSVTSFGSAGAALANAQEDPPHAIISSVLTPGMGGFELCLCVRQAETLVDVPVILVSSQHTEVEDRELAQQLGADALAADSGDWANLLALLQRVLADPHRHRLRLSAGAAREAILRRTQAQLDRQLRANATLAQRCMLQNAQLSVLAGLADSLTREPARKSALSDVLAVCLDLAGIAKGALYLKEASGLTPKHALGFDAAESRGLADFFGHAQTLDQIISQGQAVYIPSAAMSSNDAQDFLQRAGIGAAIVVPVAYRDHCYGALLLGARSADVSGHEPLSFARVLGGQVGQAIGLSDAFGRLHASEERFRGLVESMESVTVVDREQRITGAYGRDAGEETSAAGNYLGKPLEAMLGEPQTSADHEAYARALSGQSVVHEWTRGAGPSARHFRDALWPVRDAAGEVQSVVRVARDVTDEKRRQAYAMVNNRMASVGMLAAGIAHEINNPLMAVLGNLQLLLDALPPTPAAADDEEQSLTDAYDAAKRVEAIVRDLRLFSRLDADHRTPVDVQSLLDSTLRMARAALRQRARIVKNYAETPNVLACESRLGQVFLNLIINAAQALPETSEATEEIRISTSVDASGRVCIEISDTGCGIPEDVARRLFTPFLTTKPVGVGTGLGLVICQRIVSSLDGEIAFESKVGVGTTFRVLLPAAAEQERSAAPATAAAPEVIKQRGRVVIIDDEALVGTVLTKTLGRDHTTYNFTDARTALDHLRADPDVDVILCDLIMPDMSGMEFYEALVQTLPTLSPRVIFLTGGAFTRTMLEFLERVPNLHLRKPLNIGELRTLVNQRIAC